jgi:hypothetical protein
MNKILLAQGRAVTDFGYSGAESQGSVVGAGGVVSVNYKYDIWRKNRIEGLRQ